jgi:hypothetical protein
MKTDLNLELKIDKSSTNLPGTFGVCIGYEANGKKCAVLTFGKKSVMDGVDFCVEAILAMAPNCTQKELDDFKRRYP